jgi:small-conductance mechanosensitive channel
MMNQVMTTNQTMVVGLVQFLMICGAVVSGWGAYNEKRDLSDQPSYFHVSSLHEGLPELDDPPDLSTPRASIVNLLRSAQDGDFERAAWSLNLQNIPQDQRRPAHLAALFYHVLTQAVQIDYRNFPDRPDGALDLKVGSQENKEHADPMTGQPRRSLLVDDLSLGFGHAEIRLERVKPPEGEPVWLFSPRTVTNIEDMYQHYGPGPLFRHLPSSMRLGLVRDSVKWQWLLLLGAGALAIVVGWVGKKLFRVGLLWKFPQQYGEVKRLETALGWLTGGVVFAVVMYELVAAPGTILHSVYIMTMILLVVGVTWVCVQVIDLLTSIIGRRYRERMNPYEGEEGRVRLTRITVGRYAVVFLAIAIGLGLVLYELHIIKDLSLSFLASTGVAGAILGVAAHGVLGNMLAAVQIAMTKPVSIGDSVSFEGNWGVVDDITYAYVAIQTWDDRRLIVPLSYFISHPIENWSQCSTRIVKPIYLYADYRIDVDLVRTKFGEILKQSTLWDGTVEPVLQVTGMSEKTLELRALCSAKNAADAWDLHCELRESLVRLLRTMEEGCFLPKNRVEVTARPSEQPYP